MTPETPVNAVRFRPLTTSLDYVNEYAFLPQGHSYATAAEDYEDREEWGKAAEAHSQAAGKSKLPNCRQAGKRDALRKGHYRTI